ncbi:MAG: monovalent cation/H+ antiporter complex subunit F [Gemmatimonadota bacterium]
MFFISAVAILLTMGMAITRGILGPTVYDRALAVNMFGTATVLLIAVLGFLTGRPDFLDLAIVYALLSFIGTIAVLKYVSSGDLAGVGEPEEEEEWSW